MTPEEISALNDLMARKLYATYYNLTGGVGFPGLYPITDDYDQLTTEQQAIFLSMAVSVINDPLVKQYWERTASLALQEQLELCPA